MHTLLHKIFAGLVAIGTLITPSQALTPSVAAPLGGTYQTGEVRALFETSLVARITSSATSFTLTNGTDKDGTALASSTYGFVIDEGTAVEEFVLADCTGSTCTNATRGLSVRTGTTSVAALAFEHRRSASVKITDAPSLVFATNVLKGKQNIENPLRYDAIFSLSDATSTSKQIPYAAWIAANFADVYNNQSISGIKTFVSSPIVPTPTTATQAANKSYVDGVALVSAPNADYTTKGVVERATVAEITAGTSLGGTGAALFINPSDLPFSSLASTTASTTNYAPSAGVSTTTRLYAGQTALVMGTIVDTNNALYLLAKQSGYPTTTMTGPYGCSVPGGSPAVSCALPFIGTYTATNTQTVTFSIAAGVNSNPSIGNGTLGGGGSFTILKFATSSNAN